MLRSSLDEPNASSPEEENQPPLQGSNQAVSSNEQNQGQVTPQRVVKFLLSNESFLASTTSSSVGDTDAANKLGGVVDSDFEFTIAGSTLDSFSSDAPVSYEGVLLHCTFVDVFAHSIVIVSTLGNCNGCNGPL